LEYPRFSGVFSPPCPAQLLELVGQFRAWVRGNAFRGGERHLDLGEAAVTAEVGMAAIADVNAVFAGDLRQRAGPLASARLFLAVGLGWLIRLAGLGLFQLAASHHLSFLKRLVNHGATRCLASVWISPQHFCLRCTMLVPMCLKRNALAIVLRWSVVKTSVC